jgi:osmotically-inducible protein OsmY
MTTPSSPPATSDDHLRSEAVYRLAASGYQSLRKVRCEVAGGVVTLSGTVGSFHLKQVAQTLLMKVKSIQGVRNLLTVDKRQQ